jgi:hypothetical protein
MNSFANSSGINCGLGLAAHISSAGRLVGGLRVCSPPTYFSALQGWPCLLANTGPSPRGRPLRVTIRGCFIPRAAGPPPGAFGQRTRRQ